MFFSCCFSKTYEAPDVVELDWSHASLTSVPESVMIYERTLEKLDISCNQISDLPPSLFHCHELKELDLCDNEITSIPPAVGKFLKLAKLDLSRNAITDIADAMKSCKNLVYLDLSLNQLQKLPEGISQLVNLEELFLNDTYLEFLHANFGRLTKLKVLELRENSLQTLPKSMTRLGHLQRIDIGQNDIFELPEVIGTMTNLTELWCDNNNIRCIPKFIGNLTKLTCLDASQNDISEISEEICKCIHLSDLTLATNALESLPDSFPKLENLTVLRLDSNSIQYLPEDLGNLKNLQELTLIRNLLKTLPSSIGLMRKLHTLYLDDNLLTALPKEIGSCSALSVLSVAKNHLVTIPSEVGHLSNLKVLTLSGNLLAHLPVSLLNITKLGALWLSESQSKPLLPLNKEIEPGGQHVLTCYLLPQMPSSQIETTEKMTENDALLPRKSRPSIKFVTDLEPQPTESNINKRGLLRAPTPYPKELRALAKHASHLRNKDQNGDLIINDEPEYEGDYAYEDEDTGQDNDNLRKKNSSNGHYYGTNSQQPALPVKDYAEEVIVGPIRNSYRSAGNSALPAIPGPQTPSTTTNNTNIDQHFPTISLLEPRPLVVVSTEDNSAFSSSSTKQTVGNNMGPPPYHVAARRAAFFRSSPGPQSPTINLDVTRTTPMFPTTRLNSTLTNDSAINHLSTPPDSSVNIPGTMSGSNNISGSGENQHSNLVTGSFSNNEEKLLYRRESDNLEYNVVSLGGGKNISNKIQKDDDQDLGKRPSSVTLPSSTYQPEITPLIATQPSTVPKNESMKRINDTIEAEGQQRKIVEEIIEASSILMEHQHFSGNGYPVTDTNTNIDDTNQRKAITKKLSTTINTTNVEDLTNLNTGVISSTTITNTNLKGENLEISRPSTNVVADSVGQGWSSSTMESGSVVSTSESKAQFQFSSNSRGVKTDSVVNESSTGLGLSSSESFSRIPVFASSSPSKIPATTNITTYETQVPMTTYQQSQSTTTNTFSKIVQPSMKGESGGGNTLSWTRIPKLPAGNIVNSSTETNANVIQPINKKPEIIGPKPSLVRRTSSDRSRIPAKAAVPTSISPPIVSTTSSSTVTSSLPTSSSTSKIPRFGEQNKLERTLSGSRIPKINETPNPAKSIPPSTNLNSEVVVADQALMESTDTATSPVGGSKIPTKFTQNGRKPWIFGTHRNIVVVPVEYIKVVDNLGFTVTGSGNGNENGGVYVDTVDKADSTVKIGDKILQVDGIDVANMSVEIVRKILSNCQDNIHLLVSRHN